MVVVGVLRTPATTRPHFLRCYDFPVNIPTIGGNYAIRLPNTPDTTRKHKNCDAHHGRAGRFAEISGRPH